MQMNCQSVSQLTDDIVPSLNTELAGVPHATCDGPLHADELIVLGQVEGRVAKPLPGGLSPPAVPVPNPETPSRIPAPFAMQSAPRDSTAISASGSKEASWSKTTFKTNQAIETIDVN